jgi:Ca2+-binding RTX toxin-like protein
MATASLSPVLIGKVGDTAIYRVDLTQSGFSTIKTITVADDNVISGGSGAVSGIELDFVRLSSISTASASAVASLSGEDAFNFAPSGIVFSPGFLQPGSSGDNYKPYLSGTDANIYNPDKATLGTRDGSSSSSTGAISLGEGGKIQFLLSHVVSTDGKYLYVGERGGVDDKFFVTVSDEGPGSPDGGPGPSPVPSGIHLIGTSGPDTILLGQGINRHLGTGNDTIEGLAGSDKLGGAGGNDSIYGGAGHDWIYGGAGRDWLHGGTGNDRLYGGLDNDALYGGSGRDCFVFNTKLGTSKTDRQVNFDTIGDFSVKYDSLWLDNAIFKKIGKGSVTKPGQLNKEFFVTGKALENDDYLVYNKKTGILSYDADGSGSKAAVEFAQLKKGLALTYKDFFVV